MNRRHFIGSATATLGMMSAPAFAVPLARTGVPQEGRIPGEFERTKTVWLGNPDEPDFLQVTARMARALLPHVEVKLVAETQAAAATTRKALSSLGVPVERMVFLQNPKAPYFIRDYAFSALDQNGKPSVVDFQWNMYGLSRWCRSHLAPDDPARAARCAKSVDAAYGGVDQWIARQRGAGQVRSPLFMEGGAIEVNGQGVLLVSGPLALQRNPQLTRVQIERAFRSLPGISKVIWLSDGLADDPHMMATITGDYVGYGTGGHTDEFVRFADARTVLLAWIDEDTPTHPVDRLNRQRMQRNFDVLKAARDQDGRPFKIVKVPMPRPVEREVTITKSFENSLSWAASVFPAREKRRVGDRLIHVAAASYLNFIVANNLVLLPSYTVEGTPPAVEEKVRAIMQSAFPGREIQFIDATRLNWSGGGIHCATHSEFQSIA